MSLLFLFKNVFCPLQVFYEDEGTATGHFARKQELRELKILQKIEQKQFQKLGVEANLAKAEQDKEFDMEKQQLLRTYDADIEALNRQQKQQVRMFMICIMLYCVYLWAYEVNIPLPPKKTILDHKCRSSLGKLGLLTGSSFSTTAGLLAMEIGSSQLDMKVFPKFL